MRERTPVTHTDPRVVLALERTLLAWTRTALALVAFGVVVARLGWLIGEVDVPPAAFSGLGQMGALLVLLGALVQAAGLVAHASSVGRLRRGDPLPLRVSSPATLLAVLLMAAALGTSVYLAAR